MRSAVTLALMVVALVYLRGWLGLRRTLPNVLSVGQLAAFVSGLLALWSAMASPLSVLDHRFLTAHMAQHLLLMTVAAPLILLGAPVIALMHRFPRIKPVRGPHFLAHPAFCWLASTLTVIGWHVPKLFALGMRSGGWHAAEHASFFAAGLLFWWPVIQPWPSLSRWPRWSVPLYLFLATLPCDVLSAFLTFNGRVVYPHYLYAQRLFDISALGDQEIAGALMWVWVTFAYLAPAVAVTMRMLSPQRLASHAGIV